MNERRPIYGGGFGGGYGGFGGYPGYGFGGYGGFGGYPGYGFGGGYGYPGYGGLLYTSDAAQATPCVVQVGHCIIKQKTI
ncbi:hypothetical protein [Bacillus velezensis]|uniref:hypothetical protein n=1 Tax=Bacillus velezensis TaxID=492670 RepID=UPI000801A6B5|nr:hypothetical protein [Bacillus velezensis]OBR29845.1 ATP-dependent RNA helicase ded1 [Bacillus velezensis]